MHDAITCPICDHSGPNWPRLFGQGLAECPECGSLIDLDPATCDCGDPLHHADCPAAAVGGEGGEA